MSDPSNAEAVFDSVERVPAYRAAERAIRSKIMDGSLKPGVLLPPEIALAEQMGVTRPTIREALRSLEGAGLIERGPRRRMAVTAPDQSVVSTAIHEAVVLHGISYRELWEVQVVVEPAAARLAAARVNPELIARLDKNLEQTASLIDDPGALAELDVEFHNLVAEASENHALLLARAPLTGLLLPAYGTAIEGSLVAASRLLEAHSKIVDAIRAGDEETAGEWMRKHFVDFRRGCELAEVDLDRPVAALSDEEKKSA